MKFMIFYFFYIPCESHLIPSIFSSNKLSLIKRICAMKDSCNKFLLEMIFHRYFLKPASLAFVYFHPPRYTQHNKLNKATLAYTVSTFQAYTPNEKKNAIHQLIAVIALHHFRSLHFSSSPQHRQQFIDTASVVSCNDYKLITPKRSIFIPSTCHIGRQPHILVCRTFSIQK